MTRHLPPPPARDSLVEVLETEIDPDLLDRALTHRSYAYEKGGLPTNERLEFLGDAVLGLVVTAALFRRHPDLPEGQLAKQRASVVNMRALAEVARGLGPAGLGPYLLLGRGEETTGGRDKASILADTLEAIIGAVYLSGGLDVASVFVHRLFDPLLDEAAGRGAGLDWKTSLQEQTALLTLGPPEYVVEEAGPDHAKRFTAYAKIAGESLGEGEGGSKKEAEQRAAAAAFAVLEKRSAVAAEKGSPGDNGSPADLNGGPVESAGAQSGPGAGDSPSAAVGEAGGPATPPAGGSAAEAGGGSAVPTRA
jgi:ribonuclease-3